MWQRIVRRWSLAESGAAHIRPPVAAGQHWIRGALARPNNLRYASVLPAGIVRCKSTTDAAQAILWSREFNVPLIARSGGHSYAGYSTTTGLMLDLSLMNRTSFDPSTGIVTVGGGVVNRDLYRALKEANVTITHGRCPSVGGAAFVLGGGVGFNMRRYGLACDQMLKTTLVDADGNVLTATPGENADLFWACRGAGGGNLGINTSLSLQTFPVQDLTVFRLAWNSNPQDLYAALVDALAAAPATLGSRLALDAVT
ncbi:MAG TPA: FAD-dependent oxidoreductase, partial [Candidatus Binataceae bacterium]|nr:FAD-dependent oxidoreductase [Candidatus Binataceae bacterium]